MNNKSLLMIIAAVLAMASMAVSANDRGRGGFTDAGGWRLGEPVRGGYAIYRQTGRGWYRVPGAGIAIADGWVLGSGRENGGYAIYRSNGRGWDQAPGGAVRIGGSYQRPWVVNNRGQRFVWNGFDWRSEFNTFRGGDNRFERPHNAGRGYQGRNRDDFRFKPRGKSRWHREHRNQDTQRYRRGGRW
jgi:hypothetical protein